MIINPLCGDHSKGALIICLHPIDYGDEEYVAILHSVSVMCYVVVCTVLAGEKSVWVEQLSDSVLITKRRLGGKCGNYAPFLFVYMMLFEIHEVENFKKGIKISSMGLLDRKLPYKWPDIKVKTVESINCFISFVIFFYPGIRERWREVKFHSSRIGLTA